MEIIMEQNANAQTMLEWHYEENGERKGPVTDSAIKQLIQDVAKDFKQLKSMLIKIGAGICVSILIPVLLHYFDVA